jgi:hypothetical protein
MAWVMSGLKQVTDDEVGGLGYIFQTCVEAYIIKQTNLFSALAEGN